MATVLITGGTGLVGKALTKALLEKGYAVIILSRNPGKQISTNRLWNCAAWDIEKQTVERSAIEKADYIVHLAGASVAERRWTKKRKQEIIDSRIKSSALLVDAIRKYGNNVKTIISSSAIGFYGADNFSGAGAHSFSENDPPSNDFLGTTCKQWEESIEPAAVLGRRLVKMRIGIVLSNDGGALKEFIRPLKFGLATILGNGKQIISWIHIDDLVRLFIYAIENEKMNSVYNAVAPHPVSNKELILQLAEKRNKFFIPFPVPSFILKIVLGEMSIEVLKSATVSSKKIESAGFEFQCPTIETAISDLTAK
jgi:uncharacterized protein (TIGR01777 family)